MAHPNVASEPLTLMARLRGATAAICEPEILGGCASWLDYRLYLLRMYGFHAALEPALASSWQLATVVPDVKLRNHKAPLLAHDLVALGIDPRDLARLPRMTFAALGLPEALGWTYVVENMTLRGKQVAHHLARQLPAEIRSASAYLTCYGDEAPERWRELGLALDRYEQAGHDGERVIATARDGFLQLRVWVRPAVAPQPARIRA